MLHCANNGLRVAVATGHVPLSEVAASLTSELIAKKIKQLHDSMRRDFGLRKPRIAVLGLNPHAGDGGLIGQEDATVIKPAIESLKLTGLVYGPYSADGFFGNNSYPSLHTKLVGINSSRMCNKQIFKSEQLK